MSSHDDDFAMPDGWHPDPEIYDPEPEEYLAWQQVQELLDRASGLSDASPDSVESQTIEDRMNDLRVRGGDQTLNLRRHLAYGSFGAVAVQLLVANVAFYVYGFSNGWDLDASVMIAWLSATVIETLGVVLIIARNLFPTAADSSDGE